MGSFQSAEEAANETQSASLKHHIHEARKMIKASSRNGRATNDIQIPSDLVPKFKEHFEGLGYTIGISKKEIDNNYIGKVKIVTINWGKIREPDAMDANNPAYFKPPPIESVEKNVVMEL